MIHYLNALDISEKLHEAMRDSGGLPFAAIESNLAEYADNCASWHWHEAIEFAYVAEGALECATPGGTHRLEAGAGYFINANVLHLTRMASSGGTARLRVLQFDPSLLTHSVGVARRYVAPVLNCGQLEYLPLDPEAPRDREILTDLAEIFSAAADEDEGYELRVIERLFHLWRALYRAVLPQLAGDAQVSREVSERVKAMLSYIHESYGEPVSVDDIARAASVSQREAFRAFRQVLDTTPTLYLMRYRINAAARMLAETALPVTDIALACGFSSSSYFCRAFHEMTGASPREFRKNQRHANGSAANGCRAKPCTHLINSQTHPHQLKA